MSQTIFDERIVREHITNRAGRRLENELKYLQDLKSAIADCRASGDVSFRGAIAHWIATLNGRIANRKVDQRIRIPNLLREALRLVSQEVLFTTDGGLYTRVGSKLQLLYTPHVS